MATAAKDRPFAEWILVWVRTRETVCNANIYSNELIDKEQNRMELECIWAGNWSVVDESFEREEEWIWVNIKCFVKYLILFL